ncbi:uncharacterized protein [Miscanthus floridulus]|uniref:uncharacterized protein isoform X5 n=1 Tax=Miscanthus floridulus TaxID=154761 RepID=UPI00345A5F95
MGKKKTASKSQASFVDEESSLSLIENQEFVAMRAAQKVWPAPTTSEDQLRELVSDGLIQNKVIAEWRVPGEHRVLALGPGEIVLFVSFVRAGLCLPASVFLHQFLRYFGVSLNHLTPNAVLHLSVFVHLCEAFLGIPPSLSLFRFFFRLKPQPRREETSVLGGCGIQFRQGLKIKFFDYDLVDSVKDWRAEWFYAANLIPSLVVHSGSGPVANDRWDKKLESPAEIQAIQPLLDRISTLKQQGLTGFGIVSSFLRRRVQPLKERGHLGFEYSGAEDSSRMVPALELTGEEVLERLQKMLKGVSVIPPAVPEYSANNPPPAVLGRNFVDPIRFDVLPAVAEAGDHLAGTSVIIPRGPRSVPKRGRMDGSSSGLPVSKKPRKPSTPSAGALVSLAEEEEDDEVPLITRRNRRSGVSSSDALAPTSSEAPGSSSLASSAPSCAAPPVRSSSTAPAPASSVAPLSAVPLPSMGDGDVFAVVVPPARPSLGFARKKVASASSSLISPSTSSLLPAVPTSSEPRDSQHSVDEVAAGASELPGGVAGLVAPEVTVAVAPSSSGDLAPASLEVALVAPASPRPASLSPSFASGGPSLSDDVVQQFDATHRLSELTAAWGSLSTLATSFGEKLQSFSRDHSSFFFSSENERKLSSEVDALKTDLGLLRAELETERQLHQKEEKALRARVVETEKQRDAAVESAKKENKALRVEKQKLSESIDEMKALVRSSHNRAEEVNTHAEEELALARLIRRGADRDLVQAQKTIEGLSGKLATATENWNALWKSFRSVADVLRTSADDGQSWAQFIPRIPTRFQEFAKRCAQVCTKNVLAQVRVLAPEAPLSKIAEEAESQEYLDAVEKMEPEVEDLASRIVDGLNIDLSLSDDNA